MSEKENYVTDDFCMVSVPELLEALEDCKDDGVAEFRSWIKEKDSDMLLVSYAKKIEGRNIKFSLNCKILKIPEGCTSIESEVYSKRNDFIKVIFPPTLKVINYDAFYKCRFLLELEFSEGLVEIGETAFEDCKSLTKLILPDSLVKIGEGAFSGCKSLKQIKLPKGIKKIRPETFEFCSSLKELVIPDSVKRIGREAFRGCTSLERIVFPKNLRVIEKGAFAECKNLKEIVIPDSVMDIQGNAFSNCSSLEKVVLPENLTVISCGVFDGCSSLSEIKFPDSLRIIGGYAFEGCHSLKEISLPEKLKTVKSLAFNYCWNLKSIKIPESANIQIDGRAFEGCQLIKSNGHYVSYSYDSARKIEKDDPFNALRILYGYGNFVGDSAVKEICRILKTNDNVINPNWPLNEESFLSAVAQLHEQGDDQALDDVLYMYLEHPKTKNPDRAKAFLEKYGIEVKDKWKGLISCESDPAEMKACVQTEGE
ncbi:MAG: leucine-rich repeat domain-containing protein [Treponema sp.]|nr:leucine-rich repeat domain-containing protein [Treponema sp.]